MERRRAINCSKPANKANEFLILLNYWCNCCACNWCKEYEASTKRTMGNEREKFPERTTKRTNSGATSGRLQEWLQERLQKQQTEDEHSVNFWTFELINWSAESTDVIHVTAPKEGTGRLRRLVEMHRKRDSTTTGMDCRKSFTVEKQFRAFIRAESSQRTGEQ